MAGREVGPARKIAPSCHIHLEARALGLLGELAYCENDLSIVRRLGERAVAIARQVGDVHLLGELSPGDAPDRLSP